MRAKELERLKRRIASRWPSAEAFYLERDDRTSRVVETLARHATQPVEIHVDPEAAESVTVQRIALVAANLTARWARRVRVLAPASIRLHGALRHGPQETLIGRIEWELLMSDPFLDSSPFVAGERPLRLFVGPWTGGIPDGGRNDFQVHAVAWAALGRRVEVAPVPLVGGGEATVAAAALAGALGAGDLFKRAVGHDSSTWLSTFAWDIWSSDLVLGPQAWQSPVTRPVPDAFNVGRLLLAGVGAIGSALVYIMDMMPLSGDVTLFDRDTVDATNLNRSPLFTVIDAFEAASKTLVANRWIARHSGLEVHCIDGAWRDHADAFGQARSDTWISLTNEDAAWASVPFHLPPVVLHGTTTSGWGFGAGRHIPGLEDCTLCRMPRPHAEFRGPCASGQLQPGRDERDLGAPRASLPFLSTASAALLMGMLMQLETGAGVVELANQVSADLSVGLPAVIALQRAPTEGCRGCMVMRSPAWEWRGGRGRYAVLSRPLSPA